MSEAQRKKRKAGGSGIKTVMAPGTKPPRTALLSPIMVPVREKLQRWKEKENHEFRRF